MYQYQLYVLFFLSCNGRNAPWATTCDLRWMQMLDMLVSLATTNTTTLLQVLRAKGTYPVLHKRTVQPRLPLFIYSPTSNIKATPAKIHFAGGSFVFNCASNTQVGPRDIVL